MKLQYMKLKMRTSVARDLFHFDLVSQPRNPHIVFIYSSAKHRLLRHHLDLTGHAGVDYLWSPRRIVASRIR